MIIALQTFLMRYRVSFWPLFIAFIMAMAVVLVRPAIRNAASLQFARGFKLEDSNISWHNAERLQRSILRWQDNSVDDSIRLARTLVKLGEIEAAISLWEEVGQPFAPFLMFEVGNSLWNQGRKSQAMVFWRLVPDLDVYFGMHGLVFSKSGDTMNWASAINPILSFFNSLKMIRTSF